MSADREWPNCDRLIIEIEVDGFNAEGIQVTADKFADGDVLAVITEENMRDEVGVTFVSQPGEKCMNSDFDVFARTCRIVGARIERRP